MATSSAGDGGVLRCTLEEWALVEHGLDLDRLAQTESLFALSNGHVGVRGDLDEGEPHALPGTYLNGFYEQRPLPYAEAGYGYPEDGQSVVNVVNAKPIRLLVDDEPFDLRYGRTEFHQRRLDLRAGVLQRETVWHSPGRDRVRVRSTRLVSMAQRSVLATEWVVEVLDEPARVVVQSELVANEEVPPPSNDPRVAAALQDPLAVIANEAADDALFMMAETRRSALRMAVMCWHHVEGPDDLEHHSDSHGQVGRTTVITTLRPGEQLRLVKLAAYGWSEHRSLPALRDQVAAALAAARHTGWDGLLREQRAFLDRFWAGADVGIDGDDELQHAVRFALFHTLQSGVRSEGRGIPAKGLTGPGYDGHKFWDTEAYVLPVLTYTMPTAAADALAWRHRILPAARARAALLGLQGAAMPWRTIAGEECSAYWPAGTAAFHVNAAVALAVERYVAATGDTGWGQAFGLDLLVDSARMWVSLGSFDAHGGFRIDGVTGPDEYTAVADNNVYTNLTARRSLRAAAAAADVDRTVRPDVTDDEIATWRRAADAVVVPFDERLGVHPQSERFTDHALFDFAATGPAQYPLLLHVPYYELYRKQVCKQADLVMALYVCGDEFSAEEKAADFAYYEGITVRDSSLSAAIQGIVAAETGHLDLAYRYLLEAALMDVDDLERNTRDGLHIASLAGAWLMVVAGFGGMRDHGGQLSFRPRLPEQLRRVRFALRWRRSRLLVDVDHQTVTYQADGPDPVTLSSWGAQVTVHHGQHVRLDLPAPPPAPPPAPEVPGRRPTRPGT
ncbi:MAG TPA: glycosyl hydrolase family 65 protein [Acidimicrobiales bacterium]|nr:glycosyl hydrolase family 65 protein [Acidimicrobiales bacterium]